MNTIRKFIVAAAFCGNCDLVVAAVVIRQGAQSEGAAVHRGSGVQGQGRSKQSHRLDDRQAMRL
jgi:hypothetical protein